MAYKLEEIKIVPGGLNLAAPGDQVAINDCLELTGWWPSSIGRLEQSRGWTPRNTAPIEMPVHSISETTNRVYYAGGQNLYQVNRDTGSPPDAIDTDYDGFPLGLVGYQNYMWIANRAKMRKDNGIVTSDWGPPAAATSPWATTALSRTESASRRWSVPPRSG